jgi:hypothetical protein
LYFLLDQVRLLLCDSACNAYECSINLWLKEKKWLYPSVRVLDKVVQFSSKIHFIFSLFICVVDLCTNS